MACLDRKNQQLTDIKEILEGIRDPDQAVEKNPAFLEICRKNIRLHPAVGTILNHHIANDVFSINMAIGLYLSSKNPEAVPLEEAKEISIRVSMIREVMDKLREASMCEGGF